MTEDRGRPESEFYPLQLQSNYAHVTPVGSYVNEMPAPLPNNWEGGWHVDAEHSSKYDKGENGLTDFWKHKATNNNSGWYFKWLLGESEWKRRDYNSNKQDQPDQKPTVFRETGGTNWEMNELTKKAKGLGDNCHTLFKNREKSKGAHVVSRRDCNLGKRYYHGIMAQCIFPKNAAVYFNYKDDKKAHYVCAKGITFRYYVNWDEGGLSGQRGHHGFCPIHTMFLMYVNEKSNIVYLAELITTSKDESQRSSEWTSASQNKGGMDSCIQWNGHPGMVYGERYAPGEHYWNTDWNITSKSNVTGETVTTMGPPPWSEHGPVANRDYRPYDHVSKSSYPKEVVGTAAMTLSKQACQHIWDNCMVCVGYIIGSGNTVRGYGTASSDMDFRLHDVKLMEQDYRGDNRIVPLTDELVNQDDANPDHRQYFCRLMPPKQTVKEACAELRLRRTQPPKDTYTELDVTN